MGLWSVQLTCRTASQRPVKHENKTSLYVDVELLCVHAQVLLKWRETFDKLYKGTQERRNHTGALHASPEWTSESMRAEHECVLLFPMWMNHLSQWSRENKLSHTTDCGARIQLSLQPPSMSLISNFLLSPHSVPPGSCPPLLKNCYLFLFLHSLTQIFFFISSLSLSFSCHPCICLRVDEACREEEKGHWSRMKLLPVLRPHRRWLHTLRCDTASQMLCRGNYVTHAHTHTHTHLTGATKCYSLSYIEDRGKTHTHTQA